MAVTALYRISSNEVVKISVKGQTFSDRNTNVWGVLTDPVLPDGNQVRDISLDPIGPLRVLGLAKIAVPGTNTVRNSTQAEIDSFDASQVDDDNQEDADRAKDLLRNHPQFRKFAQLMFKAINRTRQDAGLTPWTKPQIVAFINAQVSKDD